MNQGDVWLIDFAPKVGDEIDKKRPAIIVSNNAIGKLRLKVVVPLTDPAQSPRSWHVLIEKSSLNGLTKNSSADCFQIKSLSNERFIKKLGVLSDQELDEVKIGLAKVLDLI
jgi:mRNA interferase MazF